VDVSIFFKDFGSYGTQIGLLLERAKEAFPQNKVFLRQRNRGQAVCILMSGDAAPPGLPNLAQQVAASLAELIRLADPLFSGLFDEASDIAGALTTALSYDLVEAPEGRTFTAMHIYRERSRKLVEAKKHQVRKKTGQLVCEVCDFDFEQTYGERGAGFIECHHIRPVKSLGDGSRTSVDDLSLVCSNCHRMIHNKQPWATVSELQEIVERARPSGHTAQQS
jgi:hypothetical protein